MEEYLDYYDEQGNHLGYKTRDEVHKEGLWHNTVHAWLYDKEGNVYFQIRKETKTFYTTASGHVAKGETIKEAFAREIKEEIGLDLNCENAISVGIREFKLDKIKENGTIFKDRAKSNIYIDLFNGSSNDFKFDTNEVLGVVKVKAKEALDLFEKEEGKIDATIIELVDNENKLVNRKVDFNEFLVNKNETAMGKYGEILNKIIEITE